MINMDYDEFHDIDGLEYLPSHIDVEFPNDGSIASMMIIPGGYIWCEHCFGAGRCECCDCNAVACICDDCCDCGIDGYYPDLGLVDWCTADGCDTETVNKSYGYHLCTECDESRHVEVKNYPDRYERMLL